MKHYDVVAAVVVFNGKILCMQRGASKFASTSYKFEFPGGKIESGETPQQALAREIKEELDYDIKVGKSLGIVNYDYPDFSISLESFLCSADSPDFKMKEHISYKWLPIENLKTLDWAAADAIFVDKLVSQYSK